MTQGRSHRLLRLALTALVATALVGACDAPARREQQSDLLHDTCLSFVTRREPFAATALIAMAAVPDARFAIPAAAVDRGAVTVLRAECAP